MTVQSNIGAPTGVADPQDITIGELLQALHRVEDRPLVFTCDGREVQPGYHVTEVKAGQFRALDCGGNPEAWTEIFVQLWDVNEDRTHMPAGFFIKIIGKVIDHISLDQQAKLTFEVSDAVQPMQLHRAGYPSLVNDRVIIALSPRPASHVIAGSTTRRPPRAAAHRRLSKDIVGDMKMDVIIYHNPACGTSRNTLGLIRNAGVEPHVIEYLRTPPSRAMLVSLVARMGIPVRSLLREKGTPFAELGLGNPALTEAEILDAMIEHPILINRPIVVSPEGVRLCRPSEAVLDLLPPQLGAFSKEDGQPVVDANGSRILPITR